MRAEFTITGDELEGLLRQAIPLTIRLDASDPSRFLALNDLAEVGLVPDLGLRVVCKGRVGWPILGINLPVTLNSLIVVLLPTIGTGPQGDVMAFRFSIEHADFSGIPGIVDTKITETINAKLAEKGGTLGWDVSRALTRSVPMPPVLEPLEGLTLRPSSAKVRVTAEAVTYSISIHGDFVRRAEITASPPPAGA